MGLQQNIGQSSKSFKIIEINDFFCQMKKSHLDQHTRLQINYNFLLAYQWGAYAIPVALSSIRRLSSIVCHVSTVSAITTRNNEDIKSIFGANVHHVPGLCLLGIGGAPYISHKIMAQKPNFYISDFFSETTIR